MNRNGKHFLIVLVLIVVATFLTHETLTAIYTLPAGIGGASEQAVSIDTMFVAHFWLISGLFSLIVVFMGYAIVVFRRKPGDEEEGAHFHSHTTLEIVWTVIPLVSVIAFGIWGAIVLDDVTAESENEMVIEVVGQQWAWTFSYPDYEEVGTSSRLVLLVDQPVLLKMNSRDVLHSFWVPEFRVKKDLVPGQETYLRITPNKIGDYKVGCAEICGFDHANMLADVWVRSEEDFRAWVVEQSRSLANLSPDERGEYWATDRGCVGCHSADGTDMIGPSWLDLFGQEEALEGGATVVVDETYLAESILKPDLAIVAGRQNIMPNTYPEQFDQREAELLEINGIDVSILNDLIAYIESLAE